MRFEIKKKGNSQVEIEVELPWQEFNEFFDLAFLEISKEIEINGFGKGKVCRDLLEKDLDPTDILNKASQLAIEKKLSQILKERDLEAISQPQVQILKLAKNNPFLFRANLWVLEPIPLADYKKIASRFRKEKVSVSEKEIEETLLRIQKSRAKIVPLLQKEAKKGDFVEIEYTYQIEGQKESSQKIKDGFVLGEGGFLNGFEQQIEKMKSGQEKEFELITPLDFIHSYLRGKKIIFKVKLLSVNKLELPPLSDEFAQEIGSFSDLGQLKESIKEGIIIEKELQQEEERKAKILEEIAKETEFEIPEILVLFEKENLYKDFQKGLEEVFKISFDEYLQKNKKTKEEVEKEIEKLAYSRLKRFLILKEIGKKEKISVSEKEIEERINNVLRQNSYQNINNLDPQELKSYYRNIIYNEKVFARLLEISDQKQN